MLLSLAVLLLSLVAALCMFYGARKLDEMAYDIAILEIKVDYLEKERQIPTKEIR
jgi:hypothetical protein